MAAARSCFCKLQCCTSECFDVTRNSIETLCADHPSAPKSLPYVCHMRHIPASSQSPNPKQDGMPAQSGYLKEQSGHDVIFFIINMYLCWQHEAQGLSICCWAPLLNHSQGCICMQMLLQLPFWRCCCLIFMLFGGTSSAVIIMQVSQLPLLPEHLF